MNANRFQRLILGMSPLAAALWGLFSVSCGEPELFCTSATGVFAFRLKPVDPAADCFKAQTHQFAVQTIYGEGKKYPNFEKATLYFADMDVYTALDGSGLMGQALVDREATVFASGAYAKADPDGKDLCYIPSAAGSVSFPAVADDPQTMDTDESAEALNRSWNWSNVVVEISPEVQGSIMWGTLAVTDGACTSTYEAKGVWPALPCTNKASCFCMDGMSTVGQAACVPTGLNPDFVDRIDCVEELCVFVDTARK